MNISSLFSHHILRPSTIKQGRASELVLRLRKIYNHHTAYPTPQQPTQIEIDLSQLNYLKLGNNQKELEKTAEYKQLVDNTRQKAQNEFTEKVWNYAYPLRQSYTANGGMFSYAQQLANKSRCNVIGVKGEYIPASEENKLQYFIFHPKNKLLGIICHLGNALLSQRC
ncbi:hypothetical protein AB6F89_20095 [Providencia hangzhouensis]|uniref:Uncharacterized protein n=1 Tax=Providencia rettgeri TaxID=587 RepID=A0AAW6UH94_PRORE|nr:MULTISPECIES: hypothetical protein [Providencia]MBG5894521.1 hypothetical protein [Providencia rettgeri]MDI9094705.1 hypothetical protein [Providencia rettgeri]MDT2035860.1 hypothetical protein [Providencia rettgeri]THB29732.1 hypothetical protein E6R27_01815 [Providencia sp. MGF014]